MVGDHFESFTEGDLVLLGGNLPHAWISDPCFLNGSSHGTCESVFVQFRKSIFGTHFFDIPEMYNIRIILQHSERGVKIEGENYDTIKKDILLLDKQPPIEQMLSLIRILYMACDSNFKVLASLDYARQGIFRSEKMTRVHNYLMQNFKDEVNVNDCAKVAGMTTTSFCRFIKKHTNVTFSVYRNYLRINLAQKLLRKTSLPVKEIAYECGFLSVTYFNQKFKKLTGTTPLEYRQESK